MDLYHIWCDLKPGVRDTAFNEAVSRYLDHLRAEKKIESWRLTRRKLGLGPAGIGEFHVIIETKNLAQLDAAFHVVASRTGRGRSFRRQFAGAERDLRALSRFS